MPEHDFPADEPLNAESRGLPGEDRRRKPYPGEHPVTNQIHLQIISPTCEMAVWFMSPVPLLASSFHPLPTPVPPVEHPPQVRLGDRAGLVRLPLGGILMHLAAGRRHHISARSKLSGQSPHGRLQLWLSEPCWCDYLQDVAGHDWTLILCSGVLLCLFLRASRRSLHMRTDFLASTVPRDVRR